MDYRKNMKTPQEMIDPELLLRLMRENEPVTATFGNCVSRENRRKGNSCGCGCGNGNEKNDRAERTRNSCGCGNGNERMRNSCENLTRQEEPDRCPNESCVHDDCLQRFPLAMAYVPMQEWEGIYDDEAALANGTLFEALHLPWYPSACDKKCRDNR